MAHFTIPSELEQFVDQEVASGKYRSADEVVSQSLRLLQERERKLEALKADIQVGLDELDRGEGLPLDVEGIKSLF